MKLWNYLIILSASLSVLFPQKYSTKALTDSGFENVYTETKDNISILIYENRIYRSELKAMGAILDILQKSEPLDENIRLIPLNRGIPLVSVDFKQYSDSRNLTQVSVNPDYLSNSPENTSLSFFPVIENWRENSSFGKWELTLIPDVRAKFHTSEGFIRLKINAISEASLTLGKGLKLTSQIMVPLAYQFEEEIAEIKPGSSYLNYTLRLKNDVWVSTSTGMFHWKSGNYKDNLSGEHLGLHEWYRYGISVETAKYFSEGKYSLFLKTDLTGHLSYQKSKWFYSSLNDRFTWFAGAGYRLDYPDLYIQLGWGKDLYEDIPFEVKMIRSFGELDLGVFLLWNEQDALEAYTGGASISVPLPYFNFNKNNTLISSSKRFNWFIWYHSGFGGRYPKTNNSIQTYQKRLLPTYIINNEHLTEGVH